MSETITIETTVHAPIETVWHHFTSPDSIVEWNAASPDWHTTDAENEVRVGGRFSFRMEAKDGSEGFDFSGVYTTVAIDEQLAYTLDDDRTVTVTFEPEDDVVHITQTFEAETENPLEMQRAGWQAILDSFTTYVEAEA